MKSNSSGKSLTVIFLAIVLLMLLSAVDWHYVSDGRINNFSLIEDIYLESPDAQDGSLDGKPSADLIDPALVAAMDEVTSEIELPVRPIPSDNVPVNITPDTVLAKADTLINEQPADSVLVELPLISPVRVAGVLPIEDYTAGGTGLSHFCEAIDRRAGRRARIAVIGDSYIEGDIFTQDIRRLLQSEYGGSGVGYMSMHSDFPGFRRSVNQSDKGWIVVDMRNNSRDTIKPLSGEYSLSGSSATTTFKGAKLDHTDRWSSTTLLFISPSNGTITISTDDGSNEIPVEKSDGIQSVSVEGETTKVTISTRINGLKVLGAWLEDNRGVGVDCMSLRGNSGITHRNISIETAREMNEYIPYDLIIVEYGLNALSAKQNDYKSYAKLMSQVIARIKECYPDADILMLGVGDRGNKNGSTVKSMKTVEAMIAAQRSCARDCGILFWDTRQAMGGDDAIVDWRERGLVNADYIHLNHKGGEELAKEFVKALKLKINETL